MTMVMLYSNSQARFGYERTPLRRIAPYLIALLMSPLILLAGLGADTMRGYMVQARLSRAVDAAALAGGRVLYDEQRNSHINGFFDAAFPPGFLGAAPVRLEVDVDTATGTLRVSGAATMNRYFHGLLGYGNQTLEAVSVVRRPSRTAEPVLERNP